MATGSGNLPYDGQAVSPFDTITAAFTNETIANIEAVASGTGLGDGAVETAKIKDLNVTTAKLADGAVTPDKLGDSGWLTATIGANYTGSDGRYRKICTTVYLKGQLLRTSGNVTVSETLMTLPVGYRPTQQMIFIGAGVGASIAKIIVNTDGSVVVGASPTVATTYLFVDLISFQVD